MKKLEKKIPFTLLGPPPSPKEKKIEMYTKKKPKKRKIPNFCG
jgi:hypothetical protein